MAAKGGGRKSESSDARVPPHDENAERALFGAALLKVDSLEVLATRTRPDDFYRPNHQAIAGAMASLFERGEPADPVTLAHELQGVGMLEQIGGLVALIDLQADAPTSDPSRATRYAEIIHDHATRRRLIGFAGQAADLGYTGGGDVHDSIEQVQAALSEVAANNGSRTYSTFFAPDLAPFLDGTLEQEEPVLMARTDGKALFYAGKMHVLQAEPSSGKSWFVLACAVEVLDLGGSVVYIDYEDSPSGIVGRLLALRASADSIRERFHYVRPEGGFGLTERTELRATLDRLNPDLVVIDGVAEALARDGFDEEKNPEVVKWTDGYPRWIARTGATVVMLDHVTKDPNTRGRYARGAGAKLAAVDGAAYEVILKTPFSRHRPGMFLLKIAKDRPGGVGSIGDTAAVVKVSPHADGTLVDLVIEPPGTDLPAWKPTHVMERISRELEQVPPGGVLLTPGVLKGLLPPGTKKDLIEAALARLKQDGYVSEIRHGRMVHLRSERPYRHDDDPGPTEPLPPVTATDDAALFPEFPGMTTDELAERRARRERDKETPK